MMLLMARYVSDDIVLVYDEGMCMSCGCDACAENVISAITVSLRKHNVFCENACCRGMPLATWMEEKRDRYRLARGNSP